jgi:hypothetical protein
MVTDIDLGALTGGTKASLLCFQWYVPLNCAADPLTDVSAGGSDVFIDIGDKSWGVLACQKFYGGIARNKTLHVGDQFLSVGSNDFKVGGIDQ